jgi:hypothetical protein
MSFDEPCFLGSLAMRNVRSVLYTKLDNVSMAQLAETCSLFARELKLVLRRALALAMNGTYGSSPPDSWRNEVEVVLAIDENGSKLDMVLLKTSRRGGCGQGGYCHMTKQLGTVVVTGPRKLCFHFRALFCESSSWSRHDSSLTRGPEYSVTSDATTQNVELNVGSRKMHLPRDPPITLFKHSSTCVLFPDGSSDLERSMLNFFDGPMIEMKDTTGNS